MDCTTKILVKSLARYVPMWICKPGSISTGILIPNWHIIYWSIQKSYNACSYILVGHVSVNTARDICENSWHVNVLYQNNMTKFERKYKHTFTTETKRRWWSQPQKANYEIQSHFLQVMSQYILYTLSNSVVNFSDSVALITDCCTTCVVISFQLHRCYVIQFYNSLGY